MLQPYIHTYIYTHRHTNIHPHMTRKFRMCICTCTWRIYTDTCKTRPHTNTHMYTHGVYVYVQQCTYFPPNPFKNMIAGTETVSKRPKATSNFFLYKQIHDAGNKIILWYMQATGADMRDGWKISTVCENARQPSQMYP
jgi:hypothetical protein